MTTTRITIHATSAEHPNKAKFEGLLTYLDASSENPVGGASGRLVYVPFDVGIKALHTLEGMAVNVRSDLSGHASHVKVGVIEKAWAGNRLPDGSVPIFVSGYLYAADFPDVVEDLRAEKEHLGFSYETKDTFGYDMPNASKPTLYVTDVGSFTGAAILYKKKAAYTRTSFAAESEEIMNEEQVKALIEQMLASAQETIAALTAKVDELSTALTASSEKVEVLEGELAQAKASLAASGDTPVVSVEEFTALKAQYDEMKAKVDELAPHAAALKAEAEAKEQYARKSTAFPMTLAAKYSLEESDDLATEIKAIEARKDLSIEDRFALKAEAMHKHRQKNVQ